MTKMFQSFLCLFGLVCICIAGLHWLLGPAAIPGSVPVNATMDSEDRFYATLMAGYGIALLWCAKDVESKGVFVRFLALIFFAGGVARIVSMLVVGPPDGFFVVMTGLELVIPVIMIAVQARLSRA